MLLACLGSLGFLGLLYLLAYVCFFSFSLSCSFIDAVLIFHTNEWYNVHYVYKIQFHHQNLSYILEFKHYAWLNSLGVCVMFYLVVPLEWHVSTIN